MDFAIAVSVDDIPQFQPFLRFYTASDAPAIVEGTFNTFQPFLRFYRWLRQRGEKVSLRRISFNPS